MRRFTVIPATAIALLLAGCVSTAGPFVTNISSDGHGGLVVEKCMVSFNEFTSTVSNGDCTSTTIVLRDTAGGN